MGLIASLCYLATTWNIFFIDYTFEPKTKSAFTSYTPLTMYLSLSIISLHSILCGFAKKLLIALQSYFMV